MTDTPATCEHGTEMWQHCSFCKGPDMTGCASKMGIAA